MLEVGKKYRVTEGCGCFSNGDILTVHSFDDKGYPIFEEDKSKVRGWVTYKEWGLSPIEESDPVNNPSHYTSHPSGIECIAITEHMGFCLGNAVKYIWRADLKHDAIEDLKKAAWYIQREIEKREKE